MSDVYREGIGEVSAADMASARAMDCTIKLLAICERTQADSAESVAVRVHPAMLPRAHPLANVGDAFNAVFVEAEAAGSLMFAVASAFAEQSVSIQTVRQEGRGDAATLVLVTHSATDAALAETVRRISAMPFVGRAASVMRVEGTSE